MTYGGWAIIVILVAMLAVYAMDRFRVELVAMVGLAAGYGAGVVPAHTLFAGFSNPAVITVAEVLLIVSALSSTRVVDGFARYIVGHTRNETAALAIICGLGGFVSIFMNNIGALALMFPVTLSVCARLGIPPSRVLMPLSFATLLGGTCSLTGTPANLVVNQWVIAETGRSLSYFELALIGGPVALAGFAWLIFAAPRFFGAGAAAETSPFEAGPSEFLAEALVPASSPMVGLPLPDAEEKYGLTLHGVIRDGAHVFARRSDIIFGGGESVLVEAPIVVLDALDEEGVLRVSPATVTTRTSGRGDAERVELLVMPDSIVQGTRVGDVLAFADRPFHVVALASRRRRVEGRFDDLQISMGDVLVLAGERDAIREAASECGLLLLSHRKSRRALRRGWPNVAVFAAGISLSAFGVIPTQMAFGAVVLAMVLMGGLNLRRALQDMNWSIVLLLAFMIPLGLAVESTGAASVIANLIAHHLPMTDPAIVGGVVLMMAVVITPFIDNVSTAVVLSPIAAGISARTGVAVEPLLMAVAVGASLDFLTPFGHHNNAVVMGAGGYRFRDFSRFGAPLLAICVMVAMLCIAAL